MINKKHAVSENRKWFILGGLILFNDKSQPVEIISNSSHMNVIDNVIWYLINNTVYKIDLHTGENREMGTIQGYPLLGIPSIIGDKNTCVLQLMNKSKIYQGEYVNNEFIITKKDISNYSTLLKDLWKGQVLYHNKDLGKYTIQKNDFFYESEEQNLWNGFVSFTSVENEVCHVEISNGKLYLVFLDYFNSTEKILLPICSTNELYQWNHPSLHIDISNDRTKIVVGYITNGAFHFTVDTISKRIETPVQKSTTGIGIIERMMITNSGSVIIPNSILDGVDIHSVTRGFNEIKISNKRERNDKVKLFVIEEDLYVYIYNDVFVNSKCKVFHC
jgi:hypothetical protein